MKKRIFISFAIEDKNLCTMLAGQAKSDKTPFEFVDMSAKQPWDSAWKTNCRTKIKGCDGAIVIVTHSSRKADGQLWEVKCAKEEGIPCYGIWGYSNDHQLNLPSELSGIRIVDWTWDGIAHWIDSL